MEVYEINVKIYTLQNILKEESLELLSKLLDQSFYKNEKMRQFHKENKIKNYCFNSLYPLASNNEMYKKGCIYNFQVRCIGEDLISHFKKFLPNEHTSKIKVLVYDMKKIPKRPIERIYSITPLIIKISDEDKTQYWRNIHNESDFFEYIRKSTIKKYELVTEETVDDSLQLFNYERIDNRKPVATKFKDKSILGDKVTLTIDTNEKAQNIAYTILGTGIADMCPRGYGFMNYQYVK
ncbi:CRISPR-associated endoribonuclease Cas6 [Clostridium sp. WILCCON 0269]|uniref:CRISPR-associated endoribonuclease Cas6 n=1 Tax=Candidatus Clostridium eludens TaxID=3381663 RepID=A0ABW8SG50_9CLOT